jgi:hypothetical protein
MWVWSWLHLKSCKVLGIADVGKFGGALLAKANAKPG